MTQDCKKQLFLIKLSNIKYHDYQIYPPFSLFPLLLHPNRSTNLRLVFTADLCNMHFGCGKIWRASAELKEQLVTSWNKPAQSPDDKRQIKYTLPADSSTKLSRMCVLSFSFQASKIKSTHAAARRFPPCDFSFCTVCYRWIASWQHKNVTIKWDTFMSSGSFCSSVTQIGFPRLSRLLMLSGIIGGNKIQKEASTTMAASNSQRELNWICISFLRQRAALAAKPKRCPSDNLILI